MLADGEMNRVLFQQLLRGDYGVEEAVALDAGVKLPEIDQYGTDGHVGADVEPLHFAGDLVLDIAADFKLTLRLDDVRRAGGLDQKIYLAASASRISPVAVGRGGKVSSGRENAIWQFHARKGAGRICRRFARWGWRRMPGRHFANFARVAVRKFYVHSSML